MGTTAEGKATVKDISTCDLGVKFSGLQPFDAPYQVWDTDYETYSIVISCIPILNALGQSGSLPFSRGCFKQKFTVPAGSDFVDIKLPFNTFSDKWSSATGEHEVECAADKSVCPSAAKL